MAWAKYRTKWSSHNSIEWEWVEVADDPKVAGYEDLADLLYQEYNLDMEYGWSEHFRGIEAQYATPPVEFLRKEIDRSKKLAESYHKRAERLEKEALQLEKYQQSLV